jgi:hypothetical protein
MTQPALQGLPFRLDVGARAAARVASITRGIIAIGRSQNSADAAEFSRVTWPDDKTAGIIARTAAVPAMTTAPTQFNLTSVSDLIDLLGPLSASGALLKRALQVSVEGHYGTMVPNVTASSTGVSFIAEAAPIPVRQLSIDGTTVTHKKVALAIGLTREMVEMTNAEPLVRAALAENLSLGLDAILFDNIAVDTTRPAGLLYGVSATAATASGTNEAMITDIGALASAVAPIAGEQIAFVAAPKQAAKIRLRTLGTFPYPLFASGALTDGVVVCVALNCLAVAGSNTPPRIEVSREATFHMDTSPSALSTAGTPNTVAAPIRSMYQTDCVMVRLISDLNWALRVASGAVSWTQSVTW